MRIESLITLRIINTVRKNVNTWGKRINIECVEEALKEDPKTICVSCPYCMTMFEDGIKDKKADDKVKMLDLAEIVAGVLK